MAIRSCSSRSADTCDSYADNLTTWALTLLKYTALPYRRSTRYFIPTCQFSTIVTELRSPLRVPCWSKKLTIGEMSQRHARATGGTGTRLIW
jgi:hypothetical protein